MEGNVCFKAQDVTNGVRRLKLNKKCAQDMVVAEMLADMTVKTAHKVADLFNQRLEGKDRGEQWDTILVALLPKRQCPEKPGHYRGIAILPVLLKLYVLAMGRWFEAS